MSPNFDASFVDSFDFRSPKLARVVYGNGCVGQAAPAELRAWGVSRIVVVANRSLAVAREVGELMNAFQESGVDALLFSERMQHCPLQTAGRLASAATGHRATALVALGGSSVSDTAKAANLLATFTPTSEAPSLEDLRGRIDLGTPLAWRLISVPTTLSGGEFTPVVGISDPATGRKAVLRHPGLCSDVILLDPALQRHTPDRLWAASGFKLLDHAVERLLARNHRPLVDAQSVFGAQWLLSLLQESLGGTPGALENRGKILQALWVIQSSHGNVGTGLSHGAAHQLGAAYGLDHGCGSAICLPATLQFLSSTGRLDARRFDLVAQAFDVEPGEGAVGRVLRKMRSLRHALGLPSSLEEAGLSEIDVRALAAAVLADTTIRSSPGAPLTESDLRSLLGSIRTACALELSI